MEARSRHLFAVTALAILGLAAACAPPSGEDYGSDDASLRSKPHSCVPKTCATLGATCGTFSNGCGGTLDCGACPVTPPPPPPPSSSNAFAVPGTIEAEAYATTSAPVEIISSCDVSGGGSVVDKLTTGTWMEYPIAVATAGKYDLALRLSNNYPNARFHLEVDGADVSGSVAVSGTGSWCTFDTVTARTGLSLGAGTHSLRVYSDQQYFNLNWIGVSASGSTAPPPSGGPISSSAAYSCDFENNWCNFYEQSKLGDAPGAPRRSSIVSTARSGSYAVRLHTEPGDDNVHSSGTWERDDLTLGPDASYCNPWQEEWWAHSVMFPDDFAYSFGVVIDFHDNASGGSPNFSLMTTPGGLRLSVFGGPTLNEGRYDAYITDPYGAATGSITKNKWYDFVYHVKWSENADGLTEAWLNGVKVMSYSGANLYTGINCYLKLANYHEPVGVPSSIIHDRVVRGTSASAVALTPLQGL